MIDKENLNKAYDHRQVEDKLYARWTERGYFHGEVDEKKKPFTIVIPPPNITGQLHMGHALDEMIQDAIIRFRRMQGYAALWLPGTDHASIATEVKIVNQMAEEGLTKEGIGREAFLERAWKWKEQYGGRIVSQLKKLGSSCDWERERFTMDEGCSRAVKEVFIRLYEKGLIYRGNRIINWCPNCQTALSDAEVEYEEQASHLWHIRYAAEDGGEGIVVATTRPETMLGDTAVAVHPEDERYAHLVGKNVILPLLDKPIPVVADEYVDREFGTGAVKITPAHDPNDFEVATRHDLPIIRVLTDDGKMNENAGKYEGMDRYEARAAIEADLQAAGVLVKKEDYAHNVGSCYRCHTTVEPMVSRQWFVSMKELASMPYQEVAYQVMKEFLTDFTEEELRGCIEKAYDSKFDTEKIAPLVKVEDMYYLELFHGATIAFKDMALSILPHLMTVSAKKNGIKNDIVILTATSGDTGKAALAGFADVPGTKIIVFYPKDGVSPVQEKQMVTQRGANTHVVGIHGNFDDAQSGVKAIFNDRKLEKELDAAGYQFSSANSINIGRLVPQVAYYAYAYAQLLAQGEIADGEEMNVVVPTGNFGNILAAFYAKNMGVPIAKLICASNENKVLFDFFRTGTYDRNREFILTSSPSMDILISSNLERLIYRIVGENSAKNAEFMNELSKDGRYTLNEDMRGQLKDFYGNYTDEQGTADVIREVYQNAGYIMDTHTAVAAHVAKQYRKETGDTRKTVIASTASPYKFTRSVMSAIDQKYNDVEDFALIDELNRISGVKIPQAIEDIRTAPVLHHTVCEKDEMVDVIKKFLRVQ